MFAYHRTTTDDNSRLPATLPSCSASRRVPAGNYLRCRSFSSNALADFRGQSTRSWAILARRLRSANVFRTVSSSVRITLGTSSIGDVGAIVGSRLLPDLHVWSAVQRHLVVAARRNLTGKQKLPIWRVAASGVCSSWAERGPEWGKRFGGVNVIADPKLF